ncbi:hypothetical protein [Bradyrhizobium liaoningense]|uniref:hypothetical protein n=1 Tax=Bradyrhizobium liaoningense TaxID=43992 RepID=UPI001BAAD2A6|nr:hypothetical protein [Bradyrhizobium liaoningense]MBR0713649.1 hypothetical protein [Bradyrhizobium liaoningense]
MEALRRFEEFATEILAVIAKNPDLTLLETIAELRKRRFGQPQFALSFSRPPQHHPQKSPQAAKLQRADVARAGRRRIPKLTPAIPSHCAVLVREDVIPGGHQFHDPLFLSH